MTRGAPAVALDTSCIIALLCGWHTDHDAVREELERRLAGGDSLLVPGHALFEAYAVLTRLPPPHRLAPGDALSLLEENFADDATLAPLPADEHWAVLGRAPAIGVAGGRTYDAVVAESARSGGARLLLTLNLRHFAPFADDTLEVRRPGRPERAAS